MRLHRRIGSSLFLTSLGVVVFLAGGERAHCQEETHRRVPDATDREAPQNTNQQDEAASNANFRVSGIVLLPDGSPPEQLVEIDAVCKRFRRLLAVADARGKFSFSFNKSRSSDVELTEGCMLRPILDGYRAQPVSLARLESSPHRKLDKIILQPTSENPTGLHSDGGAGLGGAGKRGYLKTLDKASRQDWDGAIAILKNLVYSTPRDSPAWLDLGKCLEVEGKFADAERAYIDAVRADPTFAPPFIHAAALEISSGRPELSLTHSQEAIDLNPKAFPNAYALNATANFSIGNTDAAEKSARAGLALDPDNSYPELEYILGMVLYNKGDRKLAEERLRKYVELSPYTPNAATAIERLAILAKEDSAATKSAAAASTLLAGPAARTMDSGHMTTMSLLQTANAPLLADSSAYTCLESVFPGWIDTRGRSFIGDPIRLEIGVSQGKEIYGPVDGKQLSSDQRSLLGSSFSTTGLFSSVARSLVDLRGFSFQSAGEFVFNRRTYVRYNFHSLPGSAGWTIAYGGESGTAEEEGWLVADSKTQVIRRVFVNATNIPKKLRLGNLNALIDYQAQTLSGRCVLLPKQARVQVRDRSEVERTSLLGFDHCRAFAVESFVSFEQANVQEKDKEPVGLTHLPLGVYVVLSLNTPISLTSTEDSDVITATVAEPVKRNGQLIIQSGALIQGHVRRNRGESSVLVEFDRVQTPSGMLPFYAQLVRVDSPQAKIRTVVLKSLSSAPESDPMLDLAIPETPGLATLLLSGPTAELPAGTRMLWKTVPIMPESGPNRTMNIQ